jgi:hypothetical protein
MIRRWFIEIKMPPGPFWFVDADGNIIGPRITNFPPPGIATGVSCATMRPSLSLRNFSNFSGKVSDNENADLISVTSI